MVVVIRKYYGMDGFYDFIENPNRSFRAMRLKNSNSCAQLS